MTILIWNCRGLGTPFAIRALRDVIQSSRPLIVALIETKVNKSKSETIRVKTGFQHCFCVPAKGKSGGLMVLWNSDIEVSLKSFSFFHIDFTVTSVGTFRATLFYGCPRTNLRSKSWELLRRLKSMSNLPWCVFGDFNEILQYSETTSRIAHRRCSMAQFQETLSSCDLFDLGFRGHKFTFSNRRQGQNEVKCRLDRVLANSAWQTLFPNFTVQHLVAHHSDHSPLLLKWVPDLKGGDKLFRFESMWMRDPNLKKIITDGWSESQGILMDKLDDLRVRLSVWNRKKFGNVNQQLRKLKVQLQRVRALPRTIENVDEETRVIRQIDEWLIREEQMWLQRSRVMWLSDGDNNTSFFHLKANSRHKANRIPHLFTSEGMLTDNPVDIQNIASTYFQNLFSSNLGISEDELRAELSHIPRKVTDYHNSLLAAPYTEREVTEALFQLHPSKAPGLDGFHAGFFQKNWSVVKHDFIASCLSALNDGMVLPRVNDTLIILLPKQKIARRMEEYRPISLTTVISKTIAKAVVNRLQAILPEVISPQQTAFIKGRLITDNFLIAHEAAHYIRNVKRVKQAFGSLKLDMSKAYDRIEWNFLKEMLIQLGFDRDWVDKIMRYVSSVRYCLRVNESITTTFSPERGLRQGDPLSPYLFILCTEWLSCKLNALHMSGRLTGLKIAKHAPFLTHLLYADDCLLFFKLRSNTANVVSDLLHAYERVSGQVINFGKSELMLSPNVPVDLKEEVTRLLSVKLVHCHEKYLGLPLHLKRKLGLNYTGIEDKFWSRTQGWSSKQLSIGGREVLIKSVLESLPIYSMNCFMIPDYVLKKLQSVMYKFWWGGFNNEHPIHWVNKNVLLKEKIWGGMGFRDLKCLNLAFLAKQCWRIAQNPDLILSRILKARYFHSSDIWNATVGYRPSSSWRSMLKAIDLLKAGSSTSSDGGVVWNRSSSGNLDISSAYKVAKELYVDGDRYSAESSDSSSLQSFWKSLWKLPIPRKIKIFTWRTYYDALPTGHSLSKRRLCESVKCSICGVGLETCVHALVGCWWARSVLEKLGLRNVDILLTCHHPADVLFYLWKHNSIKNYCIGLVALWYIWFNRNQVKHGGALMDSSAAARRITALATQYYFYNSHAGMGDFLFSEFEWRKPPSTFIKINCDASWDPNTKAGAVAAIARDNLGQVLAVRAMIVSSCDSALDCEGRAISEALQLGESIHHKCIIFESDCSSAVHQLNIKAEDSTRFKGWYKQCISMLDLHCDWRLYAIRREANIIADQLARHSLHSGWQWTNLDSCPNVPFLSGLL